MRHGTWKLTAMLLIAGILTGCLQESSTQPEQIADPGAKGVVLLEPNDGGTFRIGDSILIRWAVNFERISSGVSFAFSPDNGQMWAEFTPGDALALVNAGSALYEGYVGTFYWTIPATMESALGVDFPAASSQCLLKVLAPYDIDPQTQYWYEDESDMVFTVTQ